MLSSLDGGVVGSELGLEGTAGLRPRARNCWWRSPGRKGLGGITCILSVNGLGWILGMAESENLKERDGW